MKPFGYFLLLGLGAVSGTRLGAMDLQTLVDRSPFSPPKSAVAENGTQEQPGTLEFRGMVVDEAGTSYSVFDATASRGYWVREGGDGPIRVKSYNAQDSQLEIEQNGKPVKLQLKRATIQAGAPMVMSAPRPPSQPGAQPPGGGPAIGRPNGEPGADARRLEAVAAEVRRRRALRNAAANPAAAAPAAGQQAAPPPPPAQ